MSKKKKCYELNISGFKSSFCENAATWVENHPVAGFIKFWAGRCNDFHKYFAKTFFYQFRRYCIFFNVELTNFSQKTNKFLFSYYQRTINIMFRFGTTDRFFRVPPSYSRK